MLRQENFSEEHIRELQRTSRRDPVLLERVNNVSISYEEMKTTLMEDNDFKMEYDKLKSQYEIIEQNIIARKKLHNSQASGHDY